MHRSCGPTHLEAPQPDVPGNEACITPGQHHLHGALDSKPTHVGDPCAFHALSHQDLCSIQSSTCSRGEGLILHQVACAQHFSGSRPTQNPGLSSETAAFVQGRRARCPSGAAKGEGQAFKFTFWGGCHWATTWKATPALPLSPPPA